MRPTPFVLGLVLTHACNLACRYCYMGTHHRTAMPRHVAEKALDLAMKRAEAIDLSFFGGEPLLELDLLLGIADSARARARARGIVLRMQVTTNGTLLLPSVLDALHARDIHVTLSIDGDREAHDANRTASFDGAHAAARLLARSRQGLDAIAVVSPRNVRFLASSIRFIAALGAKRITMNPAFDQTWTDDDLVSWEQELESVARMWREFRGHGGPAIVSFDRKIRAAVSGGLSETEHCSAGRRNVAVAPSGNLYPCERLVRDDRPKKKRSLVFEAKDRFLMGTVDAPQIDPLPRGPSDPECGACPERSRCGASCACANLAETGAPDLPGPVQCWLERTLARLADENAIRLVEEQNETFIEWAYA